MRKQILAGLTIAALGAAMPMAAFAEDSGDAAKMKGPPNANGYSKDAKDASSTDSQASGEKMKGSPNANGYSKDAK